jgi:cell division protein FtsB
MTKIAIIFLLIISSILQIKLWFSTDGIKNIIKLNNDIIEKTRELDELQSRNNNLSQNIPLLKKNPIFIEEQARTILGMIKKNETFYRVIETSNENLIKY